MTAISELLSNIKGRGAYRPDEVKTFIRKAYQAGWDDKQKQVVERLACLGKDTR